MQISSEEITKLIDVAREVLRAEKSSSINYIDPENYKATIALKTHTVVFGRRGSGKTTLLMELEKNSDSHSEVIWVDADEYKELTFPDTLIQMFRLLTGDIIERLKAMRSKWAGWPTFQVGSSQDDFLRHIHYNFFSNYQIRSKYKGETQIAQNSRNQS